ncbi:MAG: hypothetical protein LBF57_03830, partial [Holosporaceae bacterium]|nr:hypothetical protein [Holosporaceae bacterium]
KDIQSEPYSSKNSKFAPYCSSSNDTLFKKESLEVKDAEPQNKNQEMNEQKPLSGVLFSQTQLDETNKEIEKAEEDEKDKKAPEEKQIVVPPAPSRKPRSSKKNTQPTKEEIEKQLEELQEEAKQKKKPEKNESIPKQITNISGLISNAKRVLSEKDFNLLFRKEIIYTPDNKYHMNLANDFRTHKNLFPRLKDPEPFILKIQTALDTIPDTITNRNVIEEPLNEILSMLSSMETQSINAFSTILREVVMAKLHKIDEDNIFSVMQDFLLAESTYLNDFSSDSSLDSSSKEFILKNIGYIEQQQSLLAFLHGIGNESVKSEDIRYLLTTEMPPTFLWMVKAFLAYSCINSLGNLANNYKTTNDVLCFFQTSASEFLSKNQFDLLTPFIPRMQFFYEECSRPTTNGDRTKKLLFSFLETKNSEILGKNISFLDDSIKEYERIHDISCSEEDMSFLKNDLPILLKNFFSTSIKTLAQTFKQKSISQEEANKSKALLDRLKIFSEKAIETEKPELPRQSLSPLFQHKKKTKLPTQHRKAQTPSENEKLLFATNEFFRAFLDGKYGN